MIWMIVDDEEMCMIWMIGADEEMCMIWMTIDDGRGL